jgi:biofilm PGA synthesis N-glycosyltransferase PgaC
MKSLFWISAAFIGYAYVGYAMFLSLYVWIYRRPVIKRYFTPSVSIVMAARNEADRLPGKLENLRSLRYPPKKLQIIVASDGSTDRTVEILYDHVPNVVPVVLPMSGGKASALNEAVRFATGEILVFLDVRQTVDEYAISELVACFADSEIGAVSGELLLETSPGAPSEDGLGIYWKIEKMVRKLESASGSVVGVTGAVYAMRREFYTEIPSGTILDDVFVPMSVARMGKRVVFEPSAIARDQLFSEKGKEFSRKVRTLTGNYQLLKLSPWLLSGRNPLLFRFISHKLLRLVVPFFLLLLLIASAGSGGLLYQITFWGQMIFYVFAALGMWNPSTRRWKPVGIASTFVMLNAAAAVAFYNFVTGRNEVWLS